MKYMYSTIAYNYQKEAAFGNLWNTSDSHSFALN